MTSEVEEMVGVECPLCHEEAFRLVPRRAYIEGTSISVEVECCPRCSARIDLEREERTTLDATKAMGKAERRQFFKEKSFDWADNLHGKRVVVFWDEDRFYGSPDSANQVRGTAYRTGDECGGWGRVKVIIDPTEHNRIAVGCGYTLFCEIVGMDMFYYHSGPLPSQCWGIKCEHHKLIIDGQRFGLCLNSEPDGGYSTLVSWGARKSIILDEAVGSMKRGGDGNEQG